MVYGIWLQVFDGPEALAHMRRGVAILETREQTAEEEKRGGKAKTEGGGRCREGDGGRGRSLGRGGG